jgi:ParB family chromosome partitioning protein
MARGTFGLKDLESSLSADKSKRNDKKEEGGYKKRVSSPIDAHSMKNAMGKTQRLYITLPVTQEKADCVLMELDPSRCVASPFNKRVQTLLSESDPNIAQLKASIQQDGQRDPVLARPVGKGTDQQYEIVYGTRRRFVAEAIARENPEFRLKAWVATNVSDADAKRLAESENDDREDISAWEQAQYLKQLAADNPTWTQEKLAAMEQVDQKTVSRYLQLAALPETVVKLMASPAAITRQSGVKVVKALEGLDKKALDKLMGTLQGAAPYPTTIALLAAIAEALKPKVKTAKRSKVQIKDKKGKLRANVTPHRTNKGPFNIDAYELSDDEYDKLMAELKKLLS